MAEHAVVDLAGFARAAQGFEERLGRLKSDHSLVSPGWYPYSSMTGVATLVRLLEDHFELIPALLAAEPALDVGCADGDLAFFLESLGAEVDAIDYNETNFNQLAGARRLRKLLDSRVNVYSVNLDWYFELPRARYGLILFLGTLYHLKNPFYVLEALARRGAYCLLSTRIAQNTGSGGVQIEGQPVAYLLDPREANDDSTNYWIFSETGLRRLVERAGWSVLAAVHAGRERDSNPIDSDADERLFLLLRSRVRFPELEVRLRDGWYAPEESWRWTAKHFSFEVLLPSRRPAKEFALGFHVPENLLTNGRPVEITCEIEGREVGRATCAAPGPHTFRGTFPASESDHALLEFRVEHDFIPAGDDTRELGVMVSFADELAGGRSGLPFRVS